MNREMIQDENYNMKELVMATAYCKFVCFKALQKTKPVQAMRLFVGEPVWTPVNRPADDHASRQKYVSSFLVQADPVAVT